MIRLEMRNYNKILTEKWQNYKHYHEIKVIDMKNYNKILTEKWQNYKHYHEIKVIDMNILQAKKY